MRGHILRVRPGHLSNFSGGAGYMPFVIFLSVPASFLLWLIASVTLFIRSAGVRRLPSVLDAPRPTGDTTLDYASPPRLDAHEVAWRGIAATKRSFADGT